MSPLRIGGHVHFIPYNKSSVPETFPRMFLYVIRTHCFEDGSLSRTVLVCVRICPMCFSRTCTCCVSSHPLRTARHLHTFTWNPNTKHIREEQNKARINLHTFSFSCLHPIPLSSLPSPSLFLRKKLFCISCSCVFLSYCLKLFEDYNACME